MKQEKENSQKTKVYTFIHVRLYLLGMCRRRLMYLEEELGIVPSGTSHVVLPSGPSVKVTRSFRQVTNVTDRTSEGSRS